MFHTIHIILIYDERYLHLLAFLLKVLSIQIFIKTFLNMDFFFMFKPPAKLFHSIDSISAYLTNFLLSLGKNNFF